MSDKQRHDEVRERLNVLYQDAQYYAVRGYSVRVRQIERDIRKLETEAALISYLD